MGIVNSINTIWDDTIIGAPLVGGFVLSSYVGNWWPMLPCATFSGLYAYKTWIGFGGSSGTTFSEKQNVTNYMNLQKAIKNLPKGKYYNTSVNKLEQEYGSTLPKKSSGPPIWERILFPISNFF